MLNWSLWWTLFSSPLEAAQKKHKIVDKELVEIVPYLEKKKKKESHYWEATQTGTGI